MTMSINIVYKYKLLVLVVLVVVPVGCIQSNTHKKQYKIINMLIKPYQMITHITKSNYQKLVINTHN